VTPAKVSGINVKKEIVDNIPKVKRFFKFIDF